MDGGRPQASRGWASAIVADARLPRLRHNLSAQTSPNKGQQVVHHVHDQCSSESQERHPAVIETNRGYARDIDGVIFQLFCCCQIIGRAQPEQLGDNLFPRTMLLPVSAKPGERELDFVSST